MAAVEAIPIGKAVPSKQPFLHPLNPLTGAEITSSANILRNQWPANTDLRFKTITLLEPEKSVLTQHLDSHASSNVSLELPRKSFACYYVRNTVRLHRLLALINECLL